MGDVSERNKAVVQLFYEELWNRRNLDVADENFASDCVTHQLYSGAETSAAPRNPDSVKHHVAEWLAGFPDLRFTVEQLISEDDLVVSRSVMHGTHKNGLDHGVRFAWFCKRRQGLAGVSRG